nr:MAG TPA: crystallin beta/gamma motif-containing protein [Caudoviricetes sp.]
MAITIREYLGDEKIAQLENMGFLPSLITDMAKRQYAADKQAKRNELSDAGLDGKLVQGIMRGDINEEEARNAQKFEDFGSKRHGWTLGAAKTVAGIANTVERVGDFINPFYEGKRDKDGNYIYQNGLENSLRPRIKNVENMRDDYEKATGETSWGSRLAEIGTEMVGDPVNFIGGAGLLSKGSKLARFGKKTLFFAGTGAASGGVMALGEGKNDEETLKNIGYGAAGGFVLGHAIDQGIQGISKLIAKRQASRVANEADAIDNAQNSEFLDGGNSASGDSVGAELKEAQTMTAREFATKEAGLDEDTATNVLKEAMQGKEKSDWADADTYADIVKFKNFEIQRDYAKAYGERIQTAQASINNAREQSAIRYADTQKAINEYQKQGMSPSATRELINAKFKPSADEINYTRAYNDGADVDARLAGQGIFYALEKDIAAQAYTPEIYATRLKQRGFSDESVQAFTQAYINKDINIAKDYANSKVAQAYENKIQAQIANEIRDRDELGGGFVNEEAKNNGLSDSVSDIGDNASRTGERQGDDEEILRKGGRNTSSTSQTKRTAQSDEQMEQQPAFKTDGDTDATAASKQMVEEQGSGDNEIRGHVGQTQEEYKKLVNEYDIDKFLSDRENVLSKDARHGKSRITDRTIESNDGVGGWEYKLTPAGYEKNYKADFLTTKADVAKIRAGKMDEATFNKLKSDLESSEALGYEYKKGSEYADMEDFEREFGSLYNPKGGRNINANSHIASGLVAGTLNSIDEDGSFNPNRFAAGFLVGLVGSKAAVVALKKVAPKFYDNLMNTAKGFSNKGIKEIRSEIEKTNGIVPIKEFGENYAEFYHNGEGAVQKLLAEKQGQVAGAFYRKELGDIDLVWGKVWQDQKGALQGYGLAKIKAKHPEITAENLDDVIKNGQTKIRQNEAIQIEKDGYKVVLKNNWMGEKTPNKWIVTAYEKERKVSSISSDTFTKGDNHPLTSNEIIPQQIQKGAYRDRSNAKSENAKFVQSSDITSKDVEANAKDSSVLLPTDDHIISKITETSSVSSDVFTKRDNLTSAAFEGDSAFASRTDFDKTPIKADVKTATPNDSVQGSVVKPVEHSLDNNVRSSGDIKSLEHSSDGKDVIQQNEEKVYHSRKIEEIKSEHPNVEKELDESIAAMKKESFNNSNFKDDLISKFDKKEIATRGLGKSVNLNNKQLTILRNDIKNADFKVTSDSKIYFDKIGKDGDKKRFFIDIAEDGKIRIDAYAKSQIDNIPIKENALQELAGVGDRARLKNMSFEVKAAYFNELDPIKKEAILKTAELNKLKKAAQSGDKVAVAKFEEFKAKNLDKDGNIKDGLRLC